MPCVPMWLSIVGGVLFALAGATGVAQAPGATTLTLTSDTGASTVYQVVHLSAALDGSGSAAGAVTFFDGAKAIATVPLTYPVTVLGVATLSQGTHTITAAYSGDNANATSASAPLSVVVNGLPTSFALTTGNNTVYANEPVTLKAVGLPVAATGSVALAEGTGALASVAIAGVSTAHYQAFGDSITSGAFLADSSLGYASRFAADGGFALSNDASPGSLACDLMPYQILGNAPGPTQANAPLSSVMIGTEDVVLRSSMAYETVFRACHQATLAWLAIPREYKIMAGDAAASVLSGIWTSSSGSFDRTTFGTLFNSAGSGSVQYAMTSTGTPIYLWYLMADQLSGSFTVSVDGISTGVTYSTQSSPLISSIIASTASVGFGLARITAPAGPHVVKIDVQSGSVGILAVGTPPSAGGASNHPTVLVTDVPNELTTNPAASPSITAQYTQDIQDDVTLLRADGLDLRFVTTQQLMLGTPAEMYDQVNPGAPGHAHLASAVEGVFGNTPLAAYTSFSSVPPVATVRFANPGTHVLTGTYSGDGAFAAANTTFTLNVLPQQSTSTTLTTVSTHSIAGTPVLLTASVSPGSASGAVSFYDGTQMLGQAPLVSGTAVFATSSLAVGVHSLTATYSGDPASLASTSPLLALEIDPTPTLLTLAPLPPTSTYGGSTALAATINPSTATGNITILDSLLVPGQTEPQVTTLGQASLVSGAANFNASLGVGAHTITAIYGGDTSTLSSVSRTVVTTIQAVASSVVLSPLPASLAYGSSVVFTATVTPPSATGSVMVHDSVSGTVAQSVLVNGIATSSTKTLTLGSHSLTVVYSGDSVHAGSTSQTATIQVIAAPSSITLSGVAATLSAGAPVQFAAQVNPASATGTVVFCDASAGVLGEATIDSGAATLQLPGLSAGAYLISATYSGDQYNGPSVSSAVKTQVALASTSVSLNPPTSTAVFSTALPLTATVLSNASGSTAGGLVRFVDGSLTLTTALLVHGVATTQIGTLGVGAHSIQAIYLGDDLDSPSTSSAVAITITPAPTATSMSLAQTTSSALGFVSFNVRVSTSELSSPGGQVQIRSGSAVIASGPLAAGGSGVAYATFTVSASSLGPGTFAAVASYSGDGNDLPSESSATSFTIDRIPTVTSITLSSTQVAPGSSVTVMSTAASLPNGAIPNGSIVFSYDGKTIATVALDSAGRASTTLVPSAPGSFSVSATLIPSGFFAASSAPPESLTVMLPFSIAVNPEKLDAVASSNSSATLTITPMFNFKGAIATQCVSPVAYIACTIDAVTSVAGVPTTTTVHVIVAANTIRSASIFPMLSLLLLPLMFCRKLRRPLIVVVIGVAAAATGCATGGDFFDVPPGAVPLAIRATAAGITGSTSLTVNVTR